MSYNINQIGFFVIFLGGLGLFLFGINDLCKILKSVLGPKLKGIIDKCSKNRFVGLLTGAGITALIHSSGATSALTIGLVRVGVMTLVDAAVILIGANIGTTLTSFVTALPISDILSFCVIIGSFIIMLTTRKKWQNVGKIFFSLGCIFLGLWMIGEIVKNVANQDWFINIFSTLAAYPWLSLLVGIVLTAILQSSTAVVSAVQFIYAAAVATAIATGQASTVTLFAILPVIFGSNIGSCSTAIISSIGGSKESKRVALFHLIYNIVGALLFMGLIYIFKDWLETSPTWGIDCKIQISLSHLVFNVVTAIPFFILVKPICALIEKIIPGKPKHKPIVIKELDKGILKQFPTQGLYLAKDQVIDMGNYTINMFEGILTYLETKKLEDASFVHELEESIDLIDRHLNDYLLSSNKMDMSEDDILLLSIVLKACKDIERIGDYAENLITFFETAMEKDGSISDENLKNFIQFSKDSMELIKKTIEVFRNNDKEKCIDVIKARRTINQKITEIGEAQFKFLIDNSGKEKSGKNKYMDLVFIDALNCFERINSHCSNIAKLYGNDKTYGYSVEEAEHFASMKDRY